jgi:hypothetical protein
MKAANLAGRVCSVTALTAADDDLDSSLPITGS